MVFSCKSPWNTAAVSFHIFQEYLRLTLLSAMNLAFFLVIWHLIEAGLASHFLQSVHRICSRAVSCVWSECVDVHLERLLVVSGTLDISRFDLVWVWIQEEQESTSFDCSSHFLIKLFNIKRVAKLTLKDGRLKLVTKHCGTWPVVVLLVGTEGN